MKNCQGFLELILSLIRTKVSRLILDWLALNVKNQLGMYVQKICSKKPLIGPSPYEIKEIWYLTNLDHGLWSNRSKKMDLSFKIPKRKWWIFPVKLAEEACFLTVPSWFKSSKTWLVSNGFWIRATVAKRVVVTYSLEASALLHIEHWYLCTSRMMNELEFRSETKESLPLHSQWGLAVYFFYFEKVFEKCFKSVPKAIVIQQTHKSPRDQTT